MDIFDQWSGADVRVVVTLLEKAEIKALGFESLAAHLSQTDILWHHLPIRNMEAPLTSHEPYLREVIANMAHCLEARKAVFIHCHAGLGRTGLIAATALKSFGMTTDEAIQTIRTKRPGSIENAIQESFVEAWDFKLPYFPPRL
ncbi:MAG: dual specificity protein phosphatase family protein [Proteobacteria bacterium]|nr:dual specificity protein phosphatase family protein [Pseudomonadota bacterium]MDA1152512.1 dual specificity protein phosphatase family protein [Pseudomonadota bacterium]